MGYRELGEARILKRYVKNELLKPAKCSPVQTAGLENWQTLDQAAQRFLQNAKAACVTAN